MDIRQSWSDSPWFRGYVVLFAVIVLVNLPFLFFRNESSADGAACSAQGVATASDASTGQGDRDDEASTSTPSAVTTDPSTSAAADAEPAPASTVAATTTTTPPGTTAPAATSSPETTTPDATEAAISVPPIEQSDGVGDQTSEVVVTFGRRVGARDVVVSLDIDTATAPNVVVLDDVVRQPGGDSLADAITAGIVKRGSHFVLHVCVERGSVAPGTYQGNLEIIGQEQSLMVPLRIELAPVGMFAFGVAVTLWTCVLIAGMVYVYWAVGPTVKREEWNQYVSSTQLYKRFGEWILSPGALVALVLGAVAALGVYTVSYLYRNSWGEEPVTEVITGVSAMAAAFTTAALTIYRIASPTANERIYGSTQARPGTSLGARDEIWASDATNAAKLATLGITAMPTSPWTTGQQVSVGAHAFHWDGTAWQPGPA